MRRSIHYISAFALIFGIGTIHAQQTPGLPQDGTISITGATAHIGNGTVIEDCTLVFENGELTAVGANATAQGEIIDGSGKNVYPGFIAPGKSLGLIEVNAVRASNDQDEIGSMIPHVRSLIAYNAESKVVESMRPNGVLIGQATPQGGRISGTSSIVQFDAWNWEDAVIKADDGIHMDWPNSFRQGRWWMGEEPGWKPNKDYDKQVTEIREFVQNAKAYGQASAQKEHLPYAAMQGLFEGNARPYVELEGEREIKDAITALKEDGVQKIVLVGGYQAHRVADFLKENDVPVLVNHTHTRPEFDDEDYDFTYKLPKLLSEAGLLVGMQNVNTSNFQTRNLPFYVGQVVGQGMDKEAALSLITANNAKILGIDDRYGTLEVGKSATLFISEGDALDMRGNQVTHAFIDGRKISMETHQTELWKRYMGKYENK